MSWSPQYQPCCVSKHRCLGFQSRPSVRLTRVLFSGTRRRSCKGDRARDIPIPDRDKYVMDPSIPDTVKNGMDYWVAHDCLL